MIILLAALLLAQPMPPQTVTPVGISAPNAVTVQGAAGAVPIPITGSISVTGTADTVGNTATFSANNVCTSVLTAGEQSVGFHLGAGTVAASFTPYYTQATGAVNCATAGTCTATTFASGTTPLTTTNPNAVQDLGINLTGGIRQVEVCTTAYTSGSATGNVTATFVQAAISGGGGGGTVTQGNAGTNAAAWWVRIGDATNGPVAVKPASTAAIGTDVALVVAISPNNTIAATQSGSWSVAQSGTWNIGTVSTVTAVTSITNAVTVTGTVTANAGTGTFAVSSAAQDPAYIAPASTSAPSKAPVVMGKTADGTPAYDPIPLAAGGGSVVVSGTVAITGTIPISGTITANQGTSPWVGNTTQLGGTAIATGNGTTNAGVQRITISSDSTGVIGATQSGTWNIGTVTTLSTITNPVTVAQATAANLNATVTGTVAATQSGTWNITNISGTVSLPTGASTEATLAKLPLAQASTTSGQSGPLVQCAVTTSAPTYSSTTTNPLSCDTSGNLRITGSISATNPSVSSTGSAVPASATYIGGNKGGTLTGITLDGSGNVNVNVAAGGGSGGTSSSFSAAFPATGTAAGMTDGTNMQPFKAESSSNLNLRVGLFNGTTEAAVKAASTAAVGTDPALVVAISPNNTIAATQSGSWTVAATQSGTWNIGTVSTIINPVAVTQSTSPWVENVTQFGSNAVVTGTGASGVGIPRVTVSQDSKVIGWDSFTNESLFPAGFLRTTDEPRQVFYDPFDAALDTTNRWAAPTTGGTGTPVAASVTTGVMTLASGTGTGFSYLQSQASFTPTVPAWLGTSFLIQIENPILATGDRFWGVGSSPATPTASAPITDGYGFEINTAGALNAVVFAGGTRTIVAAITSSLTDANYHRYIVYYRTDKIFWYFDNLITPVATFTATSTPGPQVQTLPIKISAAGNSSTTVVVTCAGLATWDTGKNNSTISDGTFGWRKLLISAIGGASVQGDVASGASNTGNPLQNGGRAATAVPTAVSDGQRAVEMLDKFGRVVIVPQGDRALVTQATVTLTASTSETTLLAAVASTFLDLTFIKCSNTSTTASVISVRDATAGTVRETLVCPAAIGPCEGQVYNVPFKQTIVNNNWTVQAGTSASSIICTAQAVQNK